MIKNYIKVAWRNLVKGKLYSSINLIGLSAGMTVAILIGLWMHDELAFNKGFSNYDRLGQIWQFVSFTKDKSAYNVIPQPLAEELRTQYPDFKYVSISSDNARMVLASGDKKIARTGNYVEPDMPEMLSLQMLSGDRHALKDMHAILLSSSLAKTFFGQEDPMGRVITIDNKLSVKVAGVFTDFPSNSSFSDVSFFAPWSLYASSAEWISKGRTEWDNNSFRMYAQLKDGADFGAVSDKIRDIRMKRSEPPKYKPEFFVFPMRRWHLYADFTNGVNTGGQIQFVWLFGIVGVFVLLLACINFMNLSTARSERRAREVGIRKAIGSLRGQLLLQFFGESLMVTVIAFFLSMLLASVTLPFFNTIAGKKIVMPWQNPLFWLAGIAFSLLTGLVAGSYPALYLSSFRPVKVLKGTFRAGRFAAIPRRVLVVLQFSVSIMLIIGTIVVFRQIKFAKDLPIGYNKKGLIEVNMSTPELYRNYRTIRSETLGSGAISDFASTSISMNDQNGGMTNIQWKGKDPGASPILMSNDITNDFGKTIGWQLSKGRDFAKDSRTDSASLILNEAAAKLMGLSNPLGETIRVAGNSYTVIGVVKDMIREDPFQQVKPSFYRLTTNNINTMLLRLNPHSDAHTTLTQVGAIFRKYNPGSPFDYKWVDEEFGKKFALEERVGKLAGCFAVLAVLISCLGLFGLASFVAEQRTKEIGVRKVLGASVFILWKLLSFEFIWLVTLSLLIAIPVGYHYMNNWLLNYTYHTTLSWWIFAMAGAGAMLITLVTVSFQAVKAARINPVKSLRAE